MDLYPALQVQPLLGAAVTGHRKPSSQTAAQVYALSSGGQKSVSLAQRHGAHRADSCWRPVFILPIQAAGQQGRDSQARECKNTKGQVFTFLGQTDLHQGTPMRIVFPPQTIL